MKKLLSLLLVLTLVFVFAACAKKPADGNDPSKGGSSEPITDARGNVLPANLPEGAVTSMREYFAPEQYVEYINIFYDKKGDQFVGPTEKEGTFAVLQDEYNACTRYYVWGYNDKTRCCDFQWEIVPTDTSDLPAPGSYIRVKGDFVYNEAALDKYWIENAEVSVESPYTPEKVDYDLTTMSPTLARVQIANVVRHAAVFANKTFLVYGRALGASALQHPYYNESWQIDLRNAGDLVNGAYLLVTGTLIPDGETCYLDVSKTVRES